MRQQIVGVIGASECEPFVASMAFEVGRGIANMGAVLICGGRGGVMEAACKGASESGGLTIGVIPGNDASLANMHVAVPIVTAMGQGRNAIIVQSASVVVAIGGGYGTLSEIGIALKLNKKVIGLGTWEIPGVHTVTRPHDALALVAEELARQVLCIEPSL